MSESMSTHIDLSKNDSENLKELHSLHTHVSSDSHMSVYVAGEMFAHLVILTIILYIYKEETHIVSTKNLINQITYNSSQCKQTRGLLNINFAKELELDKYLMLFYHLKHSRWCPLSIPVDLRQRHHRIIIIMIISGDISVNPGHRFIEKWFWESERVTFVAYPWIIWSTHVCICRGRNVCTFYVPPVVTNIALYGSVCFCDWSLASPTWMFDRATKRKHILCRPKTSSIK
jgi:hypothetical protein